MLACALYSLSAIRRCPLFGVSAIRSTVCMGKSSWYIAYCPLYGRCPLFGVSAKRGSTVYRDGIYKKERRQVSEELGVPGVITPPLYRRIGAEPNVNTTASTGM